MLKAPSLKALVILAVLIKLALFSYVTLYAPEGRMETDSHDYLETGLTLAQHGVFARNLEKNSADKYDYELFRTPGYPLFLGVLHGILKLPLAGVIFVQILLSLLTALFVYKTALLIDSRLGVLSAVIILFDPNLTLHSLLIMTECVFVFLLSAFLYTFVRYLREENLKWLMWSTVILAAATYVRPASIYIGIAVGGFMLYTFLLKKPKQAVTHALIFLILAYGLLGPWTMRNYARFKQISFSNIANATIRAEGLIHSYARNKDQFTQGWPPLPYYLSATTRSLMSLYMRPASFKYFNARPLTAVMKIFDYPFLIFWFVGFCAGILGAGKNVYGRFLLLLVLYFTVISVVGTLWGTGYRFRVPMMPFIAVLAAWGWMAISERIKRG